MGSSVKRKKTKRSIIDIINKILFIITFGVIIGIIVLFLIEVEKVIIFEIKNYFGLPNYVSLLVKLTGILFGTILFVKYLKKITLFFKRVEEFFFKKKENPKDKLDNKRWFKWYFKEIEKFNKKVNGWVICSMFLIIISIIISLAIVDVMISKNKIYHFDKLISKTSSIKNETVILGYLNCTSNLYIMAVKSDNLECNIDIKNNITETNVELYSIWVGESVESITYLEFQFKPDKQKFKNTFNINLPNKKNTDITLRLNTNSTTYLNTYQELVLEEQDIALKIASDRDNLILIIFSSILSLSIFGIFTGMNNLKQLSKNN